MGVSNTSAIRAAEADPLEYMTNMRVMDIMALRMMVK